MTRQRRPRRGAQDPESQRQNAPPAVPETVANGLEAIRLHGGRDEELYLSAEGQFYEASFMTDRIVTAEENVRFIKKIEALVRSSREYKAWVSHLRNDVGLNRCSFLPNIDFSTGDVGLEMHHCPLTLFEIVDIVMTHRLGRGQAVTSMSVADEVMRLHTDGLVGVIPVCKSVHKLIHAGSLQVHPLQVHGDWLGFLRAYPDGVSEELVQRLLEFVQTTPEAVFQKAQKIDGQNASPRLRQEVLAPTPGDLRVLLMVPAA